LAAVGQERAEVASPIGAQHDCFAIDDRLIRDEGANRLNDPHKPVGEVRAARRVQI
jgi:hypothetical protein